jgi:flagellar M-ring protein FliF
MPARGAFRPEQANALRFLVSSAVAGMTPEMVSVIDASTGTMVAGNDEPGSNGRSGDHADVLRERVLRLIQARVGQGQAMVEVNVEMQRNRETIFERRLDPETRVAISSETTETSSNSDRKADGEISVASNLPDGDADASDIQNSSQNNETRERVNYEVSETTRELEILPGAVARVGVAVIVSEDALAGAEGQTTDLASQLTALEELVKSTIGYDAERGDTVTIHATRMAKADVDAELPEPSFLQSVSLDATRILQMGILGIVVIVLSLGVVRPLMRSSQIAAATSPALLPSEGGGAAAISASPRPTVADEPLQSVSIGQVLDGEISSPGEHSAVQSVLAAPNPTETSVDPVEHLKTLIDGRGEEAALVLQNWLEPTRGQPEGNHADT